MSSDVRPTIVCNLGLGDLIVLSGAIIYIRKQCGGVRVPVLDYNLTNAQALFIDYPDVELFVVSGDGELRETYKNDPNAMPCYWVRVEGVILDPDVSWDVWMYQRLGVGFHHRYTSSPVEDAAKHFHQIDLGGEPYYLVHDDQKRNFNIIYPPWHPYVRTHRLLPTDGFPFLSWVEPIRHAKELHFMDSCGVHLANSMQLDHRQDKYIHRYPRFRKPIWHDVDSPYTWIPIG